MQREDGARADAEEVAEVVRDEIDGTDYYGEDDDGNDWCYRIEAVEVL